jgi:HEAT repeat protein
MAAVLEELDTILREHRTDYLPLVRQYLDHEEVNVRLAAAEVLGYLGGSRDAKAVARRLAVEVRLTSSLNGLGEPWHGKWEYFPSVTAMADALRKLGERSVQKVLHEALEQQYEPHAIGSITSALDALSEDGEVC